MPVKNPNIDTLIRKGEKHLEKGQFEDALRIFDFTLKLDGKNEKLLEFKSIALNELDRVDEAYECLEKIAEINPEKKKNAC
jgi:tetratricopeptide (TPR) repeat protein